MKTYTDIWEGFQFRSPVNLFDPDKLDPYHFDLVKWEKHEPREVVDWVTGEKKMSEWNCFSVGELIWDKDEQCFEFHSCGMRYFEYYRHGLNKWIKAFAKLKEVEFKTTQTEEEEEDYDTENN